MKQTGELCFFRIFDNNKHETFRKIIIKKIKLFYIEKIYYGRNCLTNSFLWNVNAADIDADVVAAVAIVLPF